MPLRGDKSKDRIVGTKRTHVFVNILGRTEWNTRTSMKWFLWASRIIQPRFREAIRLFICGPNRLSIELFTDLHISLPVYCWAPVNSQLLVKPIIKVRIPRATLLRLLMISAFSRHGLLPFHGNINFLYENRQCVARLANLSRLECIYLLIEKLIYLFDQLVFYGVLLKNISLINAINVMVGENSTRGEPKTICRFCHTFSSTTGWEADMVYSTIQAMDSATRLNICDNF